MRGILIADDSEEWRSILAIALRTIPDVLVRTAGSGEEALRLIADETPHVLVTDVCMPGMSGLDLLSQLRQTPRWPPQGVVVITGEYDPGLPCQARALGANAVFEKPFSAAEIRRCVLSLLDRTYGQA